MYHEDLVNEDVLRQLAEYKRFFDETPVALIRTDYKTGEFLMANKAAALLLGYETVEELKTNERTVNLYPPEDRKKLLRMLKRHGVVENYEIKFALKSGRMISVSASLRMNCEGKCIEGCFIDITELVALKEEKLGVLKEVGRKLDKRLTAFAS